MKLKYTKSNIIRGAIIYSIGDTIAAIILNEFLWTRIVGIVFIGATVYAFEIPNYFSWIDRKTKALKKSKLTLTKTALAILYFNPFWIARHLLFIKLFSGNVNHIGWQLVYISFWSFLVNIPISFVANYVIQNRIHLNWRFLASAIFSAIMAIYYALSETIFK
ncbi:hypothetical protein [Aquimarina sediminis]|uniref:hypothetical protein n=1 Tax=Aquimarina sediminis TaxID=2070536 RepID=UPI000CA053B0|nr:hypothetical protein [Aquimarina sediminis]